LAASLGITQGSISVAKKKLQVPSAWVTKISKTLGISSDWLLYGTGEMLRGNAKIAPIEAQNSCHLPQGEPKWLAPEALPKEGYSLIPKVQARLAAGTGSLETDGEVIGYYAFKLDFLMRKGRPNKMVLMDVTGDSMEPVLMDRDSVLIDESQRSIIAGGIFAVGIEHEVYVKYLHRVPGKLVLKSKNPEYEAIEVDMDGEISDEVRIIGRVVWSCREYTR
jgi:phage repressor protein C with HTH and peptisase S24 domain